MHVANLACCHVLHVEHDYMLIFHTCQHAKSTILHVNMQNDEHAKRIDMHVDEAYRACCWFGHTCCNVLTCVFSSRPYKLWTLTCTIRVPARMLHVHSAHLFAHATDPRASHSFVLPDGRAHVLRRVIYPPSANWRAERLFLVVLKCSESECRRVPTRRG